MLWVCLNVADVCFLSRGQKTFQECLQMGRQPELRAGLWILEQTPPPSGLFLITGLRLRLCRQHVLETLEKMSS